MLFGSESVTDNATPPNMPAATGNTAPVLTSITIFFFCWAIFTYILRLWVKLPKREFWSLDDTVISLALVRYTTIKSRI